MEYIDLTDEHGNLTGEVKSRAEVHRDGLWHKCVHVWLMNSNNELTVQKRSALKESNPNKWTVSASGHISAGTTSLQAAIQEVSEELGVTIKSEQLEYLFSVKEVGIDGTFNYKEIQEVYLVNTNVTAEDMKLQKEEVSEVKILPYTELEKWIAQSPEDFSDHDAEYEKLFKLLYERTAVAA